MSDESSKKLPDLDGSAELAIDFTTFVLSMSSSCLIQLGEMAGPDGERMRSDLGMARHSIEILQMLEQKTNGNLDGDECRLLSHVISDLVERFEKVASASKK